MNFGSIFGSTFAYIEIGTGIISSVGAIQHLIQSPGPVTDLQLQMIAGPILNAVQIIFPTAKIDPVLLSEISQAVAVAINKYYKKVVVVPIATAPHVG